MFDVARLSALCPGADAAVVDGIVPALETQAGELLDTPLRRAHFIAQVAWESGGFRRLVEDLDYSAGRIAEVWPRLASRAVALAGAPEALANAAYPGRCGNGPESSGDGWRYRGRGLIQITGRTNYAVASLWPNVPLWLLEEPKLAGEPVTAVAISLGFWRARGCNVMADLDDIKGVTRLVNGSALEELDARTALLGRARTIFI